MSTHSVPSVSHVMTAQPWTIERDATLRDAHALMQAHQIRHLPVLEGGRLVGLVTDRDLRLLEATTPVDAATTPVDRAMTDRPFIVTSDTALDEVVSIMSDHKYGSAIVVGRDGVEGIFTSVDACRVLAELLQREQIEM
ncbi:MAG TPA: CBS domain-containing protein [Kofleriaceae bacterium]